MFGLRKPSHCLFLVLSHLNVGFCPIVCRCDFFPMAVPKNILTGRDLCWLHFFVSLFSLAFHIHYQEFLLTLLQILSFLIYRFLSVYATYQPIEDTITIWSLRLLPNQHKRLISSISYLLMIPWMESAALFDLAQQQRSCLTPPSVLSCFHFSISVCLSSWSVCSKLYFPIRVKLWDHLGLNGNNEIIITRPETGETDPKPECYNWVLVLRQRFSKGLSCIDLSISLTQVQLCV